MTFERALHRYADRIYRLALVREPEPQRAARATTQAFLSLDWSAQDADELVEARLIAALPTVPTRRFRVPRRTGGAAALPPHFWNLDPDTRLAFALRWSRGYDAATIAPLIRRTPDTARALLEAALDWQVSNTLQPPRTQRAERADGRAWMVWFRREDTCLRAPGVGTTCNGGNEQNTPLPKGLGG